MILPCLTYAPSPGMGRGVYTSEPIAAGTIVEVAPVIVMEGADRKHIDQTLLHDYIFEWGQDGQRCAMALGLVPMYNHLAPSNCEYEMDYEEQVITVKAMRDIAAGEELFINYNGDFDDLRKVWFQ